MGDSNMPPPPTFRLAADLSAAELFLLGAAVAGIVKEMRTANDPMIQAAISLYNKMRVATMEKN